MIDENKPAENWDDPQLLEDVTKAFDDLDAEPTPEPAEEPAGEPDPTPEPEPEPAEEPQDEPETAGEDDPTPEPEEPEEPAGEDETVAIPDSHYRAAVHMGMTAEEIAELVDKDPAVATKTLAKCYEMVNASSRQLGELGQRMRKMQEAPAAQPQAKEDPRIAKLREKYEDDPIVDLVAELLNERQQPAAPPAQEPAQSPTRSVDEEIAVRQQITTFFADPDMEAYEDFYGPAKNSEGSLVGTWDHLTPGQRANRLEMLNRAQLILDGAEAAGMNLSAAEAMERAHLEVAAPMTERIVRERIKSAVVKRAKGATLRPSGTKTPPPTGGQYSQQEHEKEVGAMIKDIFGR